MSAPKKKLWKVVEIPFWWGNNQRRRYCAYLPAAVQIEAKLTRKHAQRINACRAKRLAKQLDAYYRRVLPNQDERYRTKFEAVPMGSK